MVRRHSGYYVKTIMLTVLLIVGMSWSVLWIDPTEVADRIAISTTLGLTAIAFNFVVNDALPKIPYFTSMDYYLTLSFFAIVFTVLENVVSFYISQGGVGHDAAAAMAAAKDLDFISFIASAGVMALLTLWFLSHLFGEKCDDTNKDGIVDAAEVIAYQERVFGGKGVGGEGVVVDQRRRQGWSMSSPARLVHEAGDNPVMIGNVYVIKFARVCHVRSGGCRASGVARDRKIRGRGRGVRAGSNARRGRRRRGGGGGVHHRRSERKTPSDEAVVVEGEEVDGGRAVVRELTLTVAVFVDVHLGPASVSATAAATAFDVVASAAAVGVRSSFTWAADLAAAAAA